MARGNKDEGRVCCSGSGYGKLVFGIFVLAMGVSWLGHDMGWWNFNLPWFPLAVTLLGIAIVFGWAKHQYD